MGFGSKWIGYIQWHISTTSFSMNINGSPTSFFQSTRGLHQRDPLSPYLFVMGIKTFSLLIDKAKREDYLSGYNIKTRNGTMTNISHLLFVDDTLVFYKDFEDEMLYLSRILLFF